MKYKVGDKVRVRSDLQISRRYGSYMFSSGMDHYKGSVVTISKVHLNLYFYYIEEDEEKWIWADEMFEGLAEDELTAEEAIKLSANLCLNTICDQCPVLKLRRKYGNDGCHNTKREHTEEYLEILKQWKQDHEKKEVEVTQKIYCLVVDEERKVVHEEEIGNSDSCMNVLKNYCENHDGKFFSLMEFRYEVKQ